MKQREPAPVNAAVPTAMHRLPVGRYHSRSAFAPALTLVCLLATECGGRSPVAAPPASPARTARVAGAEWARGAVFYEIFVRSFADSNGDGIGDLRGIITRLDYLNDGDPRTTADLGVDGIWLTPIWPSPSYHGYDVTDYATVNPAFGGMADFEELCRQAHRRGLRVVIDWVMNHTSDQHPWFVDASSSLRSARRDWYVWRTNDPGWPQPFGPGRTWHRSGDAFYYGLFVPEMPDLNYRNAGVRAEMARLAGAWLGRGADGLRLDAARYLVEDGPGAGQADTLETHAVWKEFSAAVRDAAPDAVLIGESATSTEQIARYFGAARAGQVNDELTTSFNFPLAAGIVAGVRTGCANDVLMALQDMDRFYPPDAIDAPFLTNHDQVRLATQLDGAPGKLRAAAAVLLTLPGAPFIYYGEELGMVNGRPGSDDRLKRTPFPWDRSANGGFSTAAPWEPLAPGTDTANVAAESADPESLLLWYRGWIQTRRHSEALRLGKLRVISQPASACAPVLAFTRNAPGERALVVHNLSSASATVQGIESLAWRCVRCNGATLTTARGQSAVTVPAWGSAVWVVDVR